MNSSSGTDFSCFFPTTQSSYYSFWITGIACSPGIAFSAFYLKEGNTGQPCPNYSYESRITVLHDIFAYNATCHLLFILVLLSFF